MPHANRQTALEGQQEPLPNQQMAFAGLDFALADKQMVGTKTTSGKPIGSVRVFA